MTTGQWLLQYPITLPADYDMGVIRERVRTRGSALDDRAGLIAKFYCIREVGVHGSRVNQYAPFYLWGDAAAAADFLWGGAGFDGIVRDFGRPRVDTWLPAARLEGEVPPTAVRHAVLRRRTLPPGGDPIDQATALRAAIEQVDPQRTHLAIAGIDPTTWQSVEFRSAVDPGTVEDTDEMFSVLHVSQPRP